MGYSSTAFGRYQSANINATSAALVLSAGSPESRKHSKFSQFWINESLTTPSIIRLKGPVNLMTSGRCFARDRAKGATVLAAPKSKRNAAGGIEIAALANGSITRWSSCHSATASLPRNFISTSQNCSAPTDVSKSPSGRQQPQVTDVSKSPSGRQQPQVS